MADGVDPSLAELRARVRELEALVYVPGLWGCAKCGFQLLQMHLNAGDGTVTTNNDDGGGSCLNCSSPLGRVTERDAGNKMVDNLESQVDRAVAAEARVAQLEGELEEMRRRIGRLSRLRVAS